MNVKIKDVLRAKQNELMQEYDRFTELKSNNGRNPKYCRCIERKLQCVDEQADELRHILEAGGRNGRTNI